MVTMIGDASLRPVYFAIWLFLCVYFAIWLYFAILPFAICLFGWSYLLRNIIVSGTPHIFGQHSSLHLKLSNGSSSRFRYWVYISLETESYIFQSRDGSELEKQKFSPFWLRCKLPPACKYRLATEIELIVRVESWKVFRFVPEPDPHLKRSAI